MTAENAVKVQWDCEHSGNLQFLQSKNLQCTLLIKEAFFVCQKQDGIKLFVNQCI